MKYMKQAAIILVITFVSELLATLLPLPVPASIYGLLLLFLLLQTGVLKLKQIEDTAEFFLAVMPIFFIAPSVSLMTAAPSMKGNVLVILLMAMFSTVVTIIITGLVSQTVIRKKKKKGTFQSESERESAERE